MSGGGGVGHNLDQSDQRVCEFSVSHQSPQWIQEEVALPQPRTAVILTLDRGSDLTAATTETSEDSPRSLGVGMALLRSSTWQSEAGPLHPRIDRPLGRGCNLEYQQPMSSTVDKTS